MIRFSTLNHTLPYKLLSNFNDLLKKKKMSDSCFEVLQNVQNLQKTFLNQL